MRRCSREQKRKLRKEQSKGGTKMAGVGLTRFFMAKYSATNGVVTYSDGGEFMDAISFNPEIEKADNNDLYANNAVKESAGGKFAGGTITVGTDELSPEAGSFITGIALTEMEITSDAGSKTYEVMKFDNAINPPYIGFGTIRTGQINGTKYWKPYIYTKIRFDIPLDSCTTQGETIEWQTPELTATIYRDDTSTEMWHMETTCESEADAVAFIKSILNIEDSIG
jgi:hypothetical protein